MSAGNQLLTVGWQIVKVVPNADAEVLCTIMSLKNKHSTGYDGISKRILKLCG